MSPKERNPLGVVLLATLVCGQAIAMQAGSVQETGTGQVEVTRPAVAVHPAVEPIVSMRERPTGADSNASPHKRSYNVSLTGTEWTDTGVIVAAGETADFTATGSYSLGDGRAAGPEGLERGWKDLLRVFPLNSAKVGEVVGRVSDVGASVPFSVGAKSQVTFPTSGRLFLRVNLSSDLNATGSYKVQVKFANTGKAAAKVVSPTGASRVSTLVSPETFADIPRRVMDQSQHEGDMVNYALLGTEAQVRAAFKAAGWVAVDKTVQDAVLHGLLSTLSHEAYTEMPMSTLYLFGRPQDLSFARGEPLKVAAERHHLRVWQTDKSVGGMPLWVGSCTHDIGFEKDQRNGNVTHRIDPKIDDERDYLLESFDASGGFSSAAYVTPADPLTTARTATGGSFYSDGRILVMELK
jgi:LssY C-terminus